MLNHISYCKLQIYQIIMIILHSQIYYSYIMCSNMKSYYFSACSGRGSANAEKTHFDAP